MQIAKEVRKPCEDAELCSDGIDSRQPSMVSIACQISQALQSGLPSLGATQDSLARQDFQFDTSPNGYREEREKEAPKSQPSQFPWIPPVRNGSKSPKLTSSFSTPGDSRQIVQSCDQQNSLDPQAEIFVLSPCLCDKRSHEDVEREEEARIGRELSSNSLAKSRPKGRKNRKIKSTVPCAGKHASTRRKALAGQQARNTTKQQAVTANEETWVPDYWDVLKVHLCACKLHSYICIENLLQQSPAVATSFLFNVISLQAILLLARWAWQAWPYWNVGAWLCLLVENKTAVLSTSSDKMQSGEPLMQVQESDCKSILHQHLYGCCSSWLPTWFAYCLSVQAVSVVSPK